MEFTWNEHKRESNLKKHGLDFIDAKEVWNGPHLQFLPNQSRNGEYRTLTLGKIGQSLIAVVSVKRDEKEHIISVRPASRKERRYYDDATRRRLD